MKVTKLSFKLWGTVWVVATVLLPFLIVLSIFNRVSWKTVYADIVMALFAFVFSVFLQRVIDTVEKGKK